MKTWYYLICVFPYFLPFLSYPSFDAPVETPQDCIEYTPTYTTEDSLLALSLHILRDVEGLRLQPYYCPGGVRTIGYGHTRTARNYKEITVQTAENLLLDDFCKALSHVQRMSDQLAVEQSYSVALLVFNVGAYKLKGTNTLRYIQSGTKPKFYLWVYAKGKKLRGLEKRRAIESQFWDDWRLLFQQRNVTLS